METDNAFYTGLRTGHAMTQYQHWITDQHNSWLLFDDGRFHQRLNTDRFLFLDPASDRSNILQVGEDIVKAENHLRFQSALQRGDHSR